MVEVENLRREVNQLKTQMLQVLAEMELMKRQLSALEASCKQKNKKP